MKHWRQIRIQHPKINFSSFFQKCLFILDRWKVCKLFWSLQQRTNILLLSRSNTLLSVERIIRVSKTITNSFSLFTRHLRVLMSTRGIFYTDYTWRLILLSSPSTIIWFFRCFLKHKQDRQLMQNSISYSGQSFIWPGQLK